VRSFANTGLRIGLSTKSVEKCLNQYFESFADQETAYEELSFFERTIFGYRIKDLSKQPEKAEYHIPIKLMVGKPAKDTSEVTKVMTSKFTQGQTPLIAEYKYDGERSQVHFSDNKLSMFSR